MANYVSIGGLKVHKLIHDVVTKEIAPGTQVDLQAFWKGFEDILTSFSPINAALLKKRDAIQAQIDAWFLEQRAGGNFKQSEYQNFLARIGYLTPAPANFTVTTANVDPEISVLAGPQLVVPVDNARYALNAANARWGSLLDALYGTNAGPPETNGAEKGTSYNKVRGDRVFELAHQFLDTHFPITQNGQKHKYGDVIEFMVAEKTLTVKVKTSGNNTAVAKLAQPEQFVGYTTKPDVGLTSVLLKNNGLHVEIIIDRRSDIGKHHPAGVSDVVLESALTTIIDMEDSVAAVDSEDKAVVYTNWSKLMRGTLEATFAKGSGTITRKMRPDKTFLTPAGGRQVIPGRSLLLVRHVGIHMYSDMILANDRPVPEGIVDAVITTFASLLDIKKSADTPRNSRFGSMYIVKPKQHGPEEVAFTVELFARVEKLFGLPLNTLKIGVMDEERRTTVNLAQCLYAAKERVIFINTGFLDRTGDEIHTHMEAGPVLPKAAIKGAIWRSAYEDWNVDTGLAYGLAGKGQIGKGMWAKPDEMAEMVKTKVSDPKAGANTAWVPSPTAATLHALHYHQVNVGDVQKALKAKGRRARVEDILQPPMLTKSLSAKEIQHELEENCQGILGYVVRWIQQGVGCSKVPDLSDVGLMEDRATLRISSQLLANWLHHSLVTPEQVRAALAKMAAIVDRQNQSDKLYSPMAPHFNNLAFRCAEDLIFSGVETPNGYTEHLLTKYRRAEKAAKSPKSKL